MKYLAILVLLLTPALAQKTKDPHNLDALYDNKSHGPCDQMQLFADKYGTGDPLYAFMAKVSESALDAYIDESLMCADIGTGTNKQLATAVWVLRVASSFKTKMLIDRQVAVASTRLSDLAEKHNASVESCNKLRTDFLDHLDRDRNLLAAVQPQQVSRAEVVPPYIPPPQLPVRCVATSSPLGQSVVTGVNCY